MIDFEQAQALVRTNAKRLPAERVGIEEAVGRVLADDVVSGVALPPFDNSAMDGFALRSQAGPIAPGAHFAVDAEQSAGDAGQAVAGEGACEIMTGARVPDGYDRVVPIEQVEVERATDGRALRIAVHATVPAGQHVRRAGEDIAVGEQVMRAGTRLGAPHVMVLAGLGLAEVAVVQRPRVALLCTGRELLDDASQPLAPGRIRNTNGPYLRACLAELGACLTHYETVPDQPEAFADALARARATGADIVLSTGAVSMGRYDFIPGVLDALGATTLFHKVAMRPGKPLLFARLDDGTLFFGLPGNPVSSVVGVRFFVEAAMRVMCGQPEERGWRLPLLHAVEKKAGFRLHQKARVRLTADARLGVELMTGQESFKTRPLLESAVWAALPASAARIAAGEVVDVFAPGSNGLVSLGDPSP